MGDDEDGDAICVEEAFGLGVAVVVEGEDVLTVDLEEGRKWLEVVY